MWLYLFEDAHPFCNVFSLWCGIFAFLYLIISNWITTLYIYYSSSEQWGQIPQYLLEDLCLSDLFRYSSEETHAGSADLMGMKWAGHGVV